MKKKLNQEDTGSEYDVEEKLILDEINYLKQRMKIIKAEVSKFIGNEL